MVLYEIGAVMAVFTRRTMATMGTTTQEASEARVEDSTYHQH